MGCLFVGVGGFLQGRCNVKFKVHLSLHFSFFSNNYENTFAKPEQLLKEKTGRTSLRIPHSPVFDYRVIIKETKSYRNLILSQKNNSSYEI